MRKFFVIAVCCGAILVVAYAGAQPGPSRGDPPQQFHLAIPGQPIAGISVEDALAIYHRNVGELSKLPGVVSVSFTGEGLVVETANPAVLPPSVEGIPVIPILPVNPHADLEERGPLPPQTESPPLPKPPHVQDPPASTTQIPTQDCGSMARWDPTVGRCRRNVPLTKSTTKFLPPPSGVIVLRPGKVRQQADSCPPDFVETVEAGGWRFCVDPKNPEPIPPLMQPPIAGIPFEEALNILERHKDDFIHLPGFGTVYMTLDGIVVETDNPSSIPTSIEGVPIETRPRQERKFLNHTLDQPLRPLHGGAVVGDSYPLAVGTLTGIVLSQGKPWMVFPSHLLSAPINPSDPNSSAFCSLSSVCPPPLGSPPPQGASILNSCTHYLGTDQMWQPWLGAVNPQRVGFVPRWDPQPGNVPPPGPSSSDVAAAFLDNNTIEGDGSLNANRTLEGSPFTGEGTVQVGDTVTVVTGDPIGSGVHILEAEVKAIFPSYIQYIAQNPCVPGTGQALYGQISYEPIDYCFQLGDSGSPVVDSNGRIVGMINWVSVTCGEGGGTRASVIKSVLGFDTWYTTAVNDNTVGVFQGGGWRLDNGNGRSDPCGAQQSTTTDQCPSFGLAGDRPVSGQWNPSATGRQIGVFRPGAGGSQGWFYLDYNGNGLFDGCSSDRCYPFGLGGDLPVVGNWNTDAKTEIGVFRINQAGNGDWYLDKNGNGLWDGGVTDRFFSLGMTGDRPVAGDWTGTGGVTKVGIYRPGTGQWYLDNGDPAQQSCSRDQCFVTSFGGTADWPVAWNQSMVKAN